MPNTKTNNLCHRFQRLTNVFHQTAASWARGPDDKMQPRETGKETARDVPHLPVYPHPFPEIKTTTTICINNLLLNPATDTTTQYAPTTIDTKQTHISPHTRDLEGERLWVGAGTCARHTKSDRKMTTPSALTPRRDSGYEETNRTEKGDGGGRREDGGAAEYACCPTIIWALHLFPKTAKTIQCTLHRMSPSGRPALPHACVCWKPPGDRDGSPGFTRTKLASGVLPPKWHPRASRGITHHGSS